ncbi:peptidoglycan/LPS O-acetylase OafA/YrhL [Novosphingobium chloroacetimidivorans]|uniref:Peptidoglycan/LPS O-acetylase OafA/YrhL n=1 Tax=Novosphingobium chloroacetimidivorans TaxID=1428314 RepID=A0A7W7KEY6_9SPHN|nr:peptidoglycan/LPS O-acetylase OafA/YrhL [Novosphingobium chloroacetimidivorans]
MEMTFYLLYACCLPLREGRRVASITILITALYVAGLVGARNHSIASFYGNSIIFEFLMGILLGAYLIPFLRFSKALAWALLAISIVTLAFIESAAPDLPRALKFGCPAFIAIAAAVNLERRSAVPDLPALVKLGDASYSIYLSHIIVLAGLRMAVRFLGIDGSPGTAYVFIAIALLASAIVGLLIHEYIEKPLSRIKLGLGGLNNKPRNTTPQH